MSCPREKGRKISGPPLSPPEGEAPAEPAQQELGPPAGGALPPNGLDPRRPLPDGRQMVVYHGSSMNPTLTAPGMMEVLPYGGRPVRVGDVLLFVPEGGASAVVHRVVRVTPEGLITRGDNCPNDDPWRVTPGQVIGQVVAVWQGSCRRRIAGGWRGRLLGFRLRCLLPVRRGIRGLLRAPYHALSRGGRWRRLLPPAWRPRVVAFESVGGRRCVLMAGRRRVGEYDADRGAWNIRAPFRLFIDERDLPKP